MRELAKKKRLRKELKLFDVFALATGTTLSAGFFLLPGLAAQEAGPALVLAYLLAAVPLIPAMVSIVELATAMPRAGGLYYFLDRSLGPLVGTIGGLGTWLVLMLKVAFALVGMGAYLRLFFADLPIIPVAIGLAVALGVLNLFGAKLSGQFQVIAVVGLLAILGMFLGTGLPVVRPERFAELLGSGWSSILSATGLVYISYIGVTQIASLSEEVSDPERNLPRGVFLALGTTIVIYGLGTAVMVGVVPMEDLAGDLTPVATAARQALGEWGMVLLSGAALLAFTSVANGGTLSASRYPLAMSRDSLMPRIFQRLGPGRVPYLAVLTTMAVIVLILGFLDATRIAKLASAFQLLMFAFACLAVIIMRESRIESYDPGYRSPFYPWMQILGIVAPFVLIVEMGLLPILFTAGLVAASVVWYLAFARSRTRRTGAFFHILRRLAERRLDEGLDRELRQILREKGLREEDPFDHVVAQAAVLDIEDQPEFEELVGPVAHLLAERLPATAEELEEGFLEGTRIGATPVSKGVSLPHLRLFDIEQAEMVAVRSRRGLRVDVTDVHGSHSPEDRIQALFFLVSPEENPRRHLRILAQIAERVDDPDFMEEWLAARNEQELKEILLRDEHFLSLRLRKGGEGGELIGRALSELEMPEGALVALIRRNGRIVVPRGSTVLESEDRLTIVGEADDIRRLAREHKGP